MVVGIHEFRVRNMYLTRLIQVGYCESNESKAFFSLIFSMLSRRTLSCTGSRGESERTIYFRLLLKAVFGNVKYK
jgi:hypothetical protein